MRARDAILLLLVLTGIASADDPKPKPVDVKAIRDKLLLFEDTQGGTYVVLPGPDGRLFYGTTAKVVYEQIIVTKSTDGDAWSLGVYAPRVSGITPVLVQRRKDTGAFERWCDETAMPLKPIAADRAKPMLEKMQFMTNALIRRPQFFARDDAGVYYYVDQLAKAYGGQGYRVFSGKKGAMKQLPLTDVAHDTGGDVFSTKSGDVRFVVDANDSAKNSAYWIKGDKKHELTILDRDANSRVIFKDLGIYTFLGTPCDEL
jgi:hypothetical protein